MKHNSNSLPQKLTVLHLDDDQFELDRVEKSLKTTSVEGTTFHVESFLRSDAFFDRLKSKTKFDIVLLDIELDGDESNGMKIARDVRAQNKEVAIFMFSGFYDAASIAKCLAQGADDFISKKSDKGELSLRVAQSCALTRFKRPTNRPINSEDKTKAIGATLAAINSRVPRLLSSAVTAIHITGETGTGKEAVVDLFAATCSPSTPFIKVNCGAIAPTLIESELFGRVKGAFTGAINDKRGLIESASGGWIFLDEIATLNLSAQVALLRVIENQEVIRVGDNTPRKISVRFLSATNESLAQLVSDGRFRKDLWQRLCEVEIKLPPLRDRAQEIESLVHFFLKTMPGGPYEISKPALEVLCNASWKAGNIRELRNCLRAMTELHVNKLLTPVSIPERLWNEVDDDSKVDFTKTKSGDAKSNSPGSSKQITLEWHKDEQMNFDHLSDVLLLELAKWHAKDSGKISLRTLAKLIGMSRSTLSTRLRLLVDRNLIELAALSELVGVSDRAS